MGGSMSSVTLLHLYSNSIQVQVTMIDGPGGWATPVHCAAIPPPGRGDPWFTLYPEEDREYQTVEYRIPHDEGGTETIPPITFDGFGNPIQPNTMYTVSCGLWTTEGTTAFAALNITTPSASLNVHQQQCKTSVQVNGKAAGRVPVVNGQRAVTLSGEAWKNLHPGMAGMDAYEVPTPLPAMSEIKLRCCGGRTCEFFFALYNCEACTGPKPAGLAQTLVLDGWEARPCSPEFGDGFKTTAFRKTVDASEGTVKLSYNVPHKEILSVFVAEGGVVRPWCAKPHGPFPRGPGCGARCPAIV